MTIELQYTDNSYCRVVYHIQKTTMEFPVVVCLQDEGDGHIVCYHMTDWDEPIGELKGFVEKWVDQIPMPEGDTETDKSVRKFLTQAKEGVTA